MEIRRDPTGADQWFIVASEFGAEFAINGNCPVQAFGTVLGRDLYFRARHSNWNLDIANADGNLPSDGFPVSDGLFREGSFSNAGWMEYGEAVKIISRCLEDYTGALVRREPGWPEPPALKDLAN